MSFRLLVLSFVVSLSSLGAAAQSISFTPAWTQLSPANSPSPRSQATMAYSGSTGQVVLFGGFAGNNVVDETWTWDGATWTQQSPTTKPPARGGASMVYDAARGQVLLFGGAGTTSNLLSDTWAWDGTTWTQLNLSPAAAPTARYEATMAYDAATQQVVLFGGASQSNAALSDTWVWNGTAWTQQSVSSSPPARYGGMMSYDAARGQVVLFGGYNGTNANLNDTWTWNGTTWTQQATSPAPPARAFASMDFDAATGQTVLFGGLTTAATGQNDTWVWNGTTWTQQVTAGAPTSRYSPSMVYYPAAAQMLLFGGQGSGSALNDTVTLQPGAVKFSTANVCPAGASTPAPCSQTATVNFTVGSAVTISKVSVVTQGAPNLDFTSTATTCSGRLQAASSCTVTVKFAPTRPGIRYGGITLIDSSGQTAGSVLLSGNGNGPQVIFPSTTAVSTLGGGFSSPAGIAVDGSGNIFIADYANHAVEGMTPNCPSGSTTCVTALGAGFVSPRGVAVDGLGNIYVTDATKNSVSQITPGCGSATCVKTLGGGFSGPEGIAVDGFGNIYFAAASDNSIKEMTPNCPSGTTTCVTTLGGGFGVPVGVSVDGVGNVYVADLYNNAVKEMPPGCASAACVKTLGAGFSVPRSVAVDAVGNIYVADAGNYSIKQMRHDCPAGNTTCVTTLRSGFNFVAGVALDGAGNIYAIDYNANTVQEFFQATPPTVTFPTATPNGTTDTTDGVQTVTLQNNGNQPLVLSVPAAGTNPSVSAGFTLATGGGANCPSLNTGASATSLAPGSVCNLPVTFAPAVNTPTGTVSGQVLVTDNVLNLTAATQTILLSASAVAPPSPTVTGISPATGPAVGGTAVMISGTNFLSGATVKFGGVAATGVSVTNATTITATSPAGTGVVDVVVSTAGGTSPTGSADQFTYAPPTLPVGTPSGTLNATVTITQAGAVGQINVLTQGASGLDFLYVSGGSCAAGPVYAVGDVCTVQYSFTPKYPGLRLGAVTLTDSTGKLYATTFLSGTGTGPQVTLSPGTISTVAGNGLGGYVAAQDTGTTAASSAQIYNPVGVAADSAGNLYIADNSNNRVRKVTAATGAISTVAGGGTAPGTCAGSTNGLGDGCLATSAVINNVQGVAVDGAGNVYFADYNSGLIRKVTAATGIISTVAGGGSSPSSCVGSTNSIGDGCAATSAVLGGADSMAVDGAGNLYISDQYNNRIRKVTAATGLISTVAGNGAGTYNGDNQAATSAALNLPVAVSLDSAGNLYIADRTNNRIREVAAATGSISTVAGNGTAGFSGDGGSATTAQLNAPTGVVVDAAGNLYITDAGNQRVRMVAVASGSISTIAGNGGGGYDGDGGAATLAKLNAPTGLALDSVGNVYITEYSNNRVREVTATAAPVVFATTTANGTTDTTDGVQTVTLTNIGNQVLVLNPTKKGTNPSVSTGYTLATGSSANCPSLSANSAAASLVSGGSCTLPISFAPIVGTPTGTVGGQVVVQDNALYVKGATQTVSLSGSAVDLSAAMSLSITGAPQTAYAGAPFNLTVNALDANGNITPTYTGTVSFSSSDGAATLPGSYQFTSADAGTHTFPVTLVTAGNQTITATDAVTPLSATSGNILVSIPSLIVTTAVDDPSPVDQCGSAPTNGPTACRAAVVLQEVANCPVRNSPASTSCSLRDALQVASMLGSATITFDPTVFATAQTISIGGHSSLSLSGAVYVAINGPTDAKGKSLVAIDGGYDHIHSNTGVRVFSLTGTGSTTLNNLVVQNGNDGTSGGGGGIYADGGTVILNHSTVSGNAAIGAGGLGGGVYVNSGTVTIGNSTLSGSVAGNSGGGLYVNGGTVTISNSTISGNNAQTNSGGGVFLNSGSLTVSNSTLSGNTASSIGGGLVASSGTMVVSNSTFSGNSAGGFAGGIANYGGTATVSNVTFAGNSASNGGGIYVAAGKTTVGNATFAGNTATTNPDIYATVGGAIFFPLSVANSILADGYQSGYLPNSKGNNITTGANLSALGNYGGPTQTLLPLPGSAAICAGVQPQVNSVALASDQRGVAISATRYGQTACYDVGAVQTQYAMTGPLTVPSQVQVGSAISPPPNVSLVENGSPLTAGTATVTLSDTQNDLSSGTTGTNSLTTGVVTFNGVQFAAPQTSDTLTATLVLNASTPVSLKVSSNSFQVGQLTPSLTFKPSPSSQTYGTAVAVGSLNATASYNGNAVAGSFAYSASSTTQSAAYSVTGGATILPADSYTITATFTPTDTTVYKSGLTVQANYSVGLATQSISFTTAPPASATYNTQFTVVATGGGSGVALGYASAGGCTNVGATYTMTSGTTACTVTVSQAGNANYAAATNLVSTVSANVATPTLSFAAIPQHTYGDLPFNVSATSASNGSVAYSLVGGTATVGSTSGLVTLLGAGVVKLGAVQQATSSYAQTTANTQFNVLQQASVTTLVLSANSITPLQSVTLTATVAPTVAGSTTPTGSVIFFDATTAPAVQIGSAPLVNGQARLAGITLTSGAHTLSASYSNDANYLASSSSIMASNITVAAEDFTFTAGGSTTQSVVPGTSGTFTFQLAPLYDKYPGAVTFTVTGLPPGATYTVTPTTIATTAGPQTVTVIINTPQAIAMRLLGRGAPWSLALLLPLMLRRRMRRRLGHAIALALLLSVGAFALSGCGSNANGYFGQSVKNYTVTVTGTAGAVTHSSSITLQVQ